MYEETMEAMKILGFNDEERIGTSDLDSNRAAPKVPLLFLFDADSHVLVCFFRHDEGVLHSHAAGKHRVQEREEPGAGHHARQHRSDSTTSHFSPLTIEQNSPIELSLRLSVRC